MHVRRLIELAGLLASHGPVLIDGVERIAADSIEQYWTTSKVRLDRWSWTLRDFAKPINSDPQRREAQWPAVRGVLEEVLGTEMLTRVWTAVLCAYDRQHASNDAEPVARSVLIGHMEARHRVLSLMVRGSSIDAKTVGPLNHLRCRVEHWTDLLIGHLACSYDVSEFAPTPQRAKDFADEMRDRVSLAGGRHAWSMTLASLRAAFQLGFSSVSPNADLHARIAASIFSCFPPEVFDGAGLFRSLWLMRLATVADETQGMIDQMLSDDAPGTNSRPESLPTQHGNRLRRFGR